MKNRFKGILALDLDGTLTSSIDVIPNQVVSFLNQLMQKRWCLLLATGRNYNFTLPLLKGLQKPFFCAVQNGAALLQMEGGFFISRNYLPIDILDKILPLMKEEEVGLLIESGKEREDKCFFKASDFISSELEYLNFRQKIANEQWENLSSFSQLSFSDFAVGKFFAYKNKVHTLAQKLSFCDPRIQVTVIHDPFRKDGFLAHLHSIKASKSAALKLLKKKYAGPVVAAGDDQNDYEMLNEADLKIVMETAPQHMIERADIVAKAAKEIGIIPALQQALEIYNDSH